MVDRNRLSVFLGLIHNSRVDELLEELHCLSDVFPLPF